MEYIVVSTTAVDEIHVSAAASDPPIICRGGAGLYAASGVKLWDEDVSLLCGKGRDFDETLGPYLDAWGISSAAMFSVHAATPRNIIQYYPDGERIETPQFGADHYLQFVAGIAQIAGCCINCRGMYVFREAEETAFWEELLSLKKQFGFTLMWEISAASTRSQMRETITALASKVDIFSINRTEAKQVFGAGEEKCADYLADIGAPLVFFRLGSDGALMIADNKQVAVPAQTGFSVVDPTGAGNSSSGAVLAGFCQGRSLEEIGYMGSIAAGMTITQYGPANTGSAQLRAQAAKLLEEYRESKRGDEHA